MEINSVISTAGDGLWSDVQKNVKIVKLDVPYQNDEFTFGELRVYFDPQTWDVKYDGLIYTDDKFLRDLHVQLRQLGLPPVDVDYSEQGMQGVDYVSLDVGEHFLAAWNSKARKNRTN